MINKNSIVKALQSEGVVKALQLEDLTHADQLDILNSIEQSIKESKLKEKEKLQSNVKFVVEALSSIRNDLENKFETLNSKVDNKVSKLTNGKDGRDGAPGKEGRPGRDGANGPAGKDGVAGKDGISVTKAKVDIDGQLVITLSNGKIIEAGQVFSKSVSEKIRVFSNADNRVPEVVGQAGKFLTNDGLNLQWAAGGGGSMIYPGAGIPNSTGTTWGTSYTTTGSGKVVLDTSPTLVTPILGVPQSGNFSVGTFTWPTFNQNTTGTASNVTGTVAIANGGTGLTSTPANGALDIGNGSGFTRTTLIAGTNITITNGPGSITIAAASGGGSMVYPGAGIPVSTGTAWGTSKATPSGVIVGDTDTQTLTNKTLTNPTITNYTETAFTANTGTAITIALTNGTVQNLTLTGSPTITMPTAVAGKSFIMYLRTGAGSYTVTWSTVKWPAGTAPTITSTASRMDIFSFFSDGTNWYGVTVSQNYTP